MSHTDPAPHHEVADPSPSARERKILEERARTLARPPAAQEAASTIELTLFRWGRERFGIESCFLREVLRVTHLTTVPGIGEPLAGITNHRGEMLAVLDLRRVLGTEPRGITDLAWLLVVGTEAAEFGLLVEAVEENLRLDASEILPFGFGTTARDLARGTTRDGLVVIDGERLLGDPRFFLEEPE